MGVKYDPVLGKLTTASSHRTYKLLGADNSSISLKENVVAELDIKHFKNTANGITKNLVSECEELKSELLKIGEFNAWFLKTTSQEEYPYSVFFGLIPEDAYSYPLTEFHPTVYSSQEEFLRKGVNGIDFWTKWAYFNEAFYGNDINHDDDYRFLRAQKIDGSLIDYSLHEYLCEFPDMMSLDEIKWYLSQLYCSGVLTNSQYVLVPLTDRMYVHQPIYDIETLDGSSECIKNSYVYIAVFKIDEQGEANYIEVCGCYTWGNSIGSLAENYDRPPFIFCQKRKNSVIVYDVPIESPNDFNRGGCATIMINNTSYAYLNFSAKNKIFVPLRGDDIIWESTKDSFLIPLSAGIRGTVELSCIKRGEEDIILVSEHLTTSYPSSSSSAENEDMEEIEDILDYDDIKSIYSSI